MIALSIDVTMRQGDVRAAACAKRLRWKCSASSDHRAAARPRCSRPSPASARRMKARFASAIACCSRRRPRSTCRARDRHIGYVPQDALLFPNMDVTGNIRYGQAGAVGARVRIAGADPGVCNRSSTARVQELSGGEKQRVAIARALMTRPVDPVAGRAARRRRSRSERRILPYVLRIRTELHVPLIYVTHDEAELNSIADRVLPPGQLERGQYPLRAFSRGIAGRGLRGLATTLTRCRHPLGTRETASRSPDCAASLRRAIPILAGSERNRACNPSHSTRFRWSLIRVPQVGRRRQSLATRSARAAASTSSHFWDWSSAQTASMIIIEHESGWTLVPLPQDWSSLSFPLHSPSEFRMPIPQPWWY